MRRILCTVDFLIVPSKGLYGWGGGAGAWRLSSFMHLSGPRAIKFLYAPAPPPPTVWALKLPSWALVHKTTYTPMIYTALCVMLFMRAASITRASGRGSGPGNLEFSGPQMALAYRLDAISQGPINSRFPGPNTFPLVSPD
jgi:hypothetical protein